MLPLIPLLCATVQILPATAQEEVAPDLPPPPPENRVGPAVSHSIKNALVRRGFAADGMGSRVVDTLTSISQRAATFADTGASWWAYMAQARPYDPAGFLVYEGYRWRSAVNGAVGTTAPQGVDQTPGLVKGGPYWVAEGVIGSDPQFVALQVSVLDVDPKTWRLHAFSYQNPQTPEDAPKGVDEKPGSEVEASSADALPDLSQGPPQKSDPLQKVYVRDYQSDECPDGGCLRSTLYVDYHPHGAPASCPIGSYYRVGKACQPYDLRKDGGVALLAEGEQAASRPSYEHAYEALPQFVKDSALSPSTVLEMANRLWRDAALRVDFSGVPFSRVQPVTMADVRLDAPDGPGHWPKVSDLARPVPPEEAVRLPKPGA